MSALPVLGNAYDGIVSTLVAQDTTPWYKKKNLRHLYLLFIGSVLCVETTSGFDASMLNGLQSVPRWKAYFGNPRTIILGAISSMYAAGAILAVPFVPFVADRFGRRRCVQLGCLIMCIGAAIQTAAMNLGMFMSARAIIGVGITFAIVGASNLLGELAHPKERARLGSLFNAFFFTGSTLAAAITLAVFRMNSEWSWRIPSLFQVLPAAVSGCFMFFLPESPRWLLAKGRGEEAMAVIVKYHAEGDVHSEFAKAEYAQIEQTLALEKESSKITWSALLSTKGNRRRVLIASFLGLATQWSGNGLISYYLSPILENVGITDSLTKQLVNFGVTLWGAVTAFTIAFFATKFPRRRIYLMSTSSMLVIFVSWTIASERFAATRNKGSSGAVVAFIFLYQPAYALAMNALSYAFLVELFPYSIRTKGASVFQAWSRAGLFVNTFINPIGMQRAGWRYLTMYCVILGFEVVFIYFLFPETYGKSLEELAFLYEAAAQKEQVKRVEEHKDDDHALEAESMEKDKTSEHRID